MTRNEHIGMSAALVAACIGVGGWIIWMQPEEWLLTSVSFAVLSCGIWWGMKADRELLSKMGRLSDVPRDEKWCASWSTSKEPPNKSPEHNALTRR